MNDVSLPEFLQSFAWRRLRMRALELQGARCQCCGKDAKLGAIINVDHIKPRKTHPELALTLSNLQVLCDECNHGKGNWSSKDWRPTHGYFYNVASKRRLAHLWNGSDTACRMWSSGGINRTRGDWRVMPDAPDKRICHQCKAKAG